MEALNNSILDLSRPLVPDLPAACLSRQAGAVPPLGGLFLTLFYHLLHPCKRASMRASFRFSVIPAKAGIQWLIQDIPA